jgi:hypothetical protein
MIMTRNYRKNSRPARHTEHEAHYPPGPANLAQGLALDQGEGHLLYG